MPAEPRALAGLLFGLRAAAAAMLALLVAFRLQLDQPSWAATSALIVAQPVLGATLRKGALRLIGTAVGACAAVLLFAAFPQDRVGFLCSLAIWGGLCSAVGTLLGQLFAYAPLLAGYTCAIIGMDAVGDPPSVLLLAVARASCIALGIVATALVFSLTTRGRQRENLAVSLETTGEEALAGLRGAMEGPVAALEVGRQVRRQLLARASGLDAIIDQALGENLDLRSRAGVLRRALAGLFVMLSCWRGVQEHRSQAAESAADVPGGLHEAVVAMDAAGGESSGRLREVASGIEAAAAADESERLLMDLVSRGLRGLASLRAGLVLLRTPLQAEFARDLQPVRIAGGWAAANNGLRSTVTTAAAIGIWVATGWDSGPSFVTFAAVFGILFSVIDEGGFNAAATFGIGCMVAFAVSAALRFAAIPAVQGMGFDDFRSFVVVVGVPLVLFGTIGAIATSATKIGGVSLAMMAMTIPLLAPTNEISYDLSGFLNSGLAILGGSLLATVGLLIWPPLPRSIRSVLILRAARRDLRRIAAGRWRPDRDAWEARQYARLVGLPPGADVLNHARLAAALAVGNQLLLAAEPTTGREAQLRRQAAAREIAEAVASHPDFFAGLGLPPAHA